MNGDLIRRGDILDALKKEFDNFGMAFDDEEYGGINKAVPDAVRNVPIGFDVDKVVEKLERRIENFKELNSDAVEVDVAIKEIQRDIEIIMEAKNE